MVAIQQYESPLGTMLLAADVLGLTGAWFVGQKYFGAGLPAEHAERETPVLMQTHHWLDAYFAGERPEQLPPLHPTGSAFRQDVWAILLQTPYCETTTYGAIARQLAARRGIDRVSARAVGGAVGHNPVSIIIPCHRVVGSDGSLIGYAGGIERKLKLLEHEGIHPRM